MKTIILNGQEIEYRVVYKNYKNPTKKQISMKWNGVFIISGSKKILGNGIDFIKKNTEWVLKNNEYINTCKKLPEYSNGNFNKDIRFFIKKYSKKLALKKPNYEFFTNKNNWGRCYISKNLIALNTKLQYVPRNLLEYVIAHEILHFKISKHPKRFWFTLEIIYSNVLKNKKLLEKYTYKLLQEGEK